ncbi:DUF924 family protein [Muricoccus radiodurans]|uniref:DUF924 family protein n=1 Tax=Muricoccus radiodurans TaxID=2231721 RepID=UPI003CE7A8B5
MSGPDDLLEVWFGGEPDLSRESWFRVDPAFDASLRARFGAEADTAARGARDGWAETPRGALALCLLLDQVPRNIHRGRSAAFASDPHAREIARIAVLHARHDLRLTTVERVFLYLPFEHSEDIADQNLSVALFEGMRDDPRHARPGGTIDYAWRHRAVIGRFGRFPHRNAIVGRSSSAAERTYLATPGSGF